MIILDTNVISEVIKPSADPGVQAWLDEQIFETVYLTSITLAELHFGVGNLPAGKRRQRLEDLLERVLSTFGGRILFFDDLAALAFSTVALRAKRSGKGLPLADGYIAAIAASRNMMVATRDVAPFEAAGCPYINPWALKDQGSR